MLQYFVRVLIQYSAVPRTGRSRPEFAEVRSRCFARLGGKYNTCTFQLNAKLYRLVNFPVAPIFGCKSSARF